MCVIINKNGQLDKSEIAEIEKLAKLEMEYLQSLQEDVSKAVALI
ncbi:MAG TPA: hypothetical protein VFU82_00010 [Gammaproteobacteria bacterium]|nr:hypothetical protein [Gammaproteobacteria bacterium]